MVQRLEANVINNAILHWNNTLWLIKKIHVTWNIQSECIISVEQNCNTLKFVYNIGNYVLSVYLKMPVQIKIEHVDPIRSTKYIWLIYLTQVLGKLFDWLFEI